MKIAHDQKSKLLTFLKARQSPSLSEAYFFYLEHALNLKPVVFVKDKMIYKTREDVIRVLEEANKLWRETEIQIRSDRQDVNANTKRIYICPFTGKVFADNVYANPQDAIYDWQTRMASRLDPSGSGLRVKRFFVSDDPKVIAEYIKPPKAALTKTVYASIMTGRLFHSREDVINDFCANYLRSMTLEEVQNQNKYQLEESFVALLQEHLEEDRISAFVEGLADDPDFYAYVSTWVDTAE